MKIGVFNHRYLVSEHAMVSPPVLVTPPHFIQVPSKLTPSPSPKSGETSHAPYLPQASASAPAVIASSTRRQGSRAATHDDVEETVDQLAGSSSDEGEVSGGEGPISKSKGKESTEAEHPDQEETPEPTKERATHVEKNRWLVWPDGVPVRAFTLLHVLGLTDHSLYSATCALGPDLRVSPTTTRIRDP